MRPTLYALLVALALAAVSAPTAQALALPTDQQQTNRRATESLRIAEAFWGAQPTTGTPRIFKVAGAAIDALGGRVDPGAIGTTDGRDIWQAAELLALTSYEWRIRSCSSAVHEWGHALGRAHSAASRSVMSENRPDHAVVYGCYKRFMPKGKAREWRENYANGHSPAWLTR